MERLAREIVDAKLSVAANCAARTHENDIRPIVEISQRVGIPIEACTFIGSSPIRQFAEEWELDWIIEQSAKAVRFAVGEGLPVMYVTEDTTRAKPEDVEKLYTAAIEAGAKRVCVCDTVGHATPWGVRNLIRFVRGVRRARESRGQDRLARPQRPRAGRDQLHRRASKRGPTASTARRGASASASATRPSTC